MGTIQGPTSVDTFATLIVDGLRRRGSIKWSHYADDVLAAWVAEMDFPLAPELREALREAVERDVTGYPPDPDASGLPSACAAWLSRSFGMPVTPSQIRILPGVLRGIELAIQTLSLPDSPVVIMTPSYPPFFEAVRLAGRRIIEVPLLDREGPPISALSTRPWRLGRGRYCSATRTTRLAAPSAARSWGSSPRSSRRGAAPVC